MAAQKSDSPTYGEGARDARESTGDSRLYPAGPCFILARSGGEEGFEVRFSRRDGITVMTPPSGYVLFSPVRLTPS